jgi:hypothetical protein
VIIGNDLKYLFLISDSQEKEREREWRKEERSDRTSDDMDFKQRSKAIESFDRSECSYVFSYVLRMK